MVARRIIQATKSGGTSDEHQVLTTRTEVVDAFDDGLASLLQDLHDTMNSQELCIGLAAPQIGVSQKVAVAQIEDKEVLELVNPEVLTNTGKRDTKRESCMSLFGWTGSVERRHKLLVRYQDRDGETHERSFSGFPARVVLHEIDHLDGTLYIDHLSGAAEATDLFDEYTPDPPNTVD